MSRFSKWSDQIFFSEVVPDTELLAFFLTQKEKKDDGLDQAFKLMNTFGPLDLVLNTTLYQLLQEPSLSKKTIQRLTKLQELFKRASGKKKGDILDNPQKVFEICAANFLENRREKCLVLGRSKDKKMATMCFVATGDVSSVSCSIKDLFRPLFVHNLEEFIIVHNHLEQPLTPSRADLIATNQILDLAHILEFTLVDHLIIHERSYLSFYELGYLPRREYY